MAICMIVVVVLGPAPGLAPVWRQPGTCRACSTPDPPRCRNCHAPIYARWSKHAHGQRRPRSEDASRRDHPRPLKPDPLVTFTKDDIAFVYGSKWKQRYFTKVGDDYFPLGAQWDVTHKQWRRYFVARRHRLVGAALSGRQHASGRPARLCDGCHSVNYDVADEAGDRVERRLREVPRTRQRRTSRSPVAREHRQPGARSTPCTPTTPASSATRRDSRSTNPIEGSYYDWPVGFRVGLNLSDFWQLEEHKLGRDDVHAFRRTAPRTRTGCRGTISCRA